MEVETIEQIAGDSFESVRFFKHNDAVFTVGIYFQAFFVEITCHKTVFGLGEISPQDLELDIEQRFVPYAKITCLPILIRETLMSQADNILSTIALDT